MNITSSERTIMIGCIIVMTQWTCSQPARRAELMTAIKKRPTDDRDEGKRQRGREKKAGRRGLAER